MNERVIGWILSFVISLFFTALVYGIGPVILLLLHKSPIDYKKLKWFHIAYTVIISSAFNIFSSLSGYGMNFTPAIIWGLIFYRINKTQFEKRQAPPTSIVRVDDAGQAKEFVVDGSTGEVLSEKTIEAPAPIVPEKDPDPAVRPVKELEPKQNKPHEFKALCVILAVICVASLAGNGLQAYWNVSQQKNHQAGYDASKKDLIVSALPEIPFTNGKIVMNPFDQRICPLNISVKGDDSYYIYLDSESFPHNDMAFLIKPGKSVELDVPEDTYQIFYAVGQTWYGKDDLFGPDTMYYKCDGTFEFYRDEDYVYGHTIELYLKKNGNLATEKVDASSFPG